MRQRTPTLRWIAAMAIGVYGPSASAVSYRIASTGGLMQQPASHYYHAVYGGLLQIGTDSEGFLLRGQYTERPQFKSSGFIDQEYGYFAMIGTKVINNGTHGLYAFFGGGRILGYIKDDPDVFQTKRRRGYSLPGPTFAIEYGLSISKINVALNHQTFIGYQDKEQLEAYVAWPYNFFRIQLGVSI